MKKLTATLLAGLLLASSFPASAGRLSDDRHARRDRHERFDRYERHAPVARHAHQRPRHHVSGLAVLGAGLVLGSILLATETSRPRSAPLIVTPISPLSSAPPVQAVWHYCEAYRTYYPYVDSCPGGWRAVPAD